MEFLQAVDLMAKALNVTMLQVCKYCDKYKSLSEVLFFAKDSYLYHRQVAKIFDISLEEVMRWVSTRVTLQEFLESFTSKNTYITDDELQRVLKTRKKIKQREEKEQIIPLKRLSVDIDVKVTSISRDWNNVEQIKKWIEMDCYRWSFAKITEIIILDNNDFIQFSYSLDYDYICFTDGDSWVQDGGNFKYYGEYSKIIYNQDTHEMLAVDCDGQSYASYTGFVHNRYDIKELVTSLITEKTPVLVESVEIKQEVTPVEIKEETPVLVESRVKEEFNNIVPTKTVYVSWLMNIQSNGFYFDVEKMKDELSQLMTPNYRYIVKAVHLLSDKDFNYFIGNLQKVYQFDFLSKKNDDYSYGFIDSDLKTYEGENHWDKVARTCYIVTNNETQEMYAINLSYDTPKICGVQYDPQKTFIGIPDISSYHSEQIFNSQRMIDVTPIKTIETSIPLKLRTKYNYWEEGHTAKEYKEDVYKYDFCNYQDFNCKEIIVLSNDSYNFLSENLGNHYSFFDNYNEKYPDTDNLQNCSEYNSHHAICFVAYNIDTHEMIALITRGVCSSRQSYAYYVGFTDQEYLVREAVQSELGKDTDFNYINDMSTDDLKKAITYFKGKGLTNIRCAGKKSMKIEYEIIVKMLRPTPKINCYAKDVVELRNNLYITLGSKTEARNFLNALKKRYGQKKDADYCDLNQKAMENLITDWLSPVPQLLEKPQYPVEIINPDFMPYAQDVTELRNKLYIALGKKTTEVNRFLTAIKKLFGYKEENNYGELNFITMNMLITDWLAPVSKVFLKYGIKTVKQLVTTKTTNLKKNKQKASSIVGKQPVLARVSNNPIEENKIQQLLLTYLA
jgi:hypothetical protein